MVDPDTVVHVRDRLVAFVERRVADRADAEDLVHDVLLRVIAHPAPPRGEALEHWLFAATRNALTDHYRRRATASRREDRYAAESPSAASPTARVMDDGELRLALADCVAPLLGQLPSTHADAVRAVDLAGERQVDFAARTSTPLPTVKSRVQRGRVMLRAAFDACCAIAVDARGRPTEALPRAGTDCPTAPCEAVRGEG
jgi:RNA polymerase sigma-70 factor (ECF subfamily)